MAGRKRKIRTPTADAPTKPRSTKKHQATLGKSQIATRPPDPATVLTTEEAKDACVALQNKLVRDRQGRRQNGRRLKSEPFHLADSQKVIFAKTYAAAKNHDTHVDYVRLSNSCHFPTFAGNSDVLAAMEPAIITEMKEALVEQRGIETKDRHNNSIQGTLAKVQVLHQREIAKMDQKVETLLAQLATSVNHVEELRKDIAVAQEQHQCNVHRESHNAAPQQSQTDERNPQKTGCLARDPPAFKLKQVEKIRTKGYGLLSLLEPPNYKQVTLDEKVRAQDKERHRLDGRASLNERMGPCTLDGIARDQDKKQDAAIVDRKKTCDDHDSIIAEW